MSYVIISNKSFKTIKQAEKEYLKLGKEALKNFEVESI